MTADRPLRADAERNRALIIRTAERLIGRGRVVVPLNEIARESGLGVGTVYRRFAEVQELIDVLFIERFERYLAIAADAARISEPVAALRHYLLTAAAGRAADPAHDVILAHADLSRPEVSGLRDELTRRVEDLVAGARRSPETRRDFAAGDVYSILYMLGAVADRTEEIAPGAWRRYGDVLLAGFGLAPGEPMDIAPIADDYLRRAWPDPAPPGSGASPPDLNHHA